MKCHLNDDIDIILINDASEDGYNYEDIALTYHAKYIRNNERLGVAGSRDLGVELCETPYFILLDGHMRFYDDQWVKAIISELDKDDRVLLCCQTKFLNKNDNGEIVEKKQTSLMEHILILRAEIMLLRLTGNIGNRNRNQKQKLKIFPLSLVQLTPQAKGTGNT